jgi:hypothetical protein
MQMKHHNKVNIVVFYYFVTYTSNYHITYTYMYYIISLDRKQINVLAIIIMYL